MVCCCVHEGGRGAVAARPIDMLAVVRDLSGSPRARLPLGARECDADSISTPPRPQLFTAMLERAMFRLCVCSTGPPDT